MTSTRPTIPDGLPELLRDLTKVFVLGNVCVRGRVRWCTGGGSYTHRHQKFVTMSTHILLPLSHTCTRTCTQAVLREQPSDIAAFSRDFCTQLVQQRGSEGGWMDGCECCVRVLSLAFVWTQPYTHHRSVTMQKSCTEVCMRLVYVSGNVIDADDSAVDDGVTCLSWSRQSHKNHNRATMSSSVSRVSLSPI